MDRPHQGTNLVKIRNVLKGASAPIALSVVLAANPVLAQDAPVVVATEDDEEQPGAAEAGDATIFVTGSRIRRDEFSAPAPMTVIDPEIASKQGLLSLGDAIQGSPIAAGSSQVTAALSSQFTVNGGQGVQTISLRGLGAERTLVLLNGRRAGPAGTRGAVSAFDLNVLPLSLVDNIDVLKDGASSIYGSDAVAGVVNITTKRDTDGVEFDFFGSVPQRSGGEQWAASATWGKTFDRGHVLLSANYFRQNELVRGDRDYLGCSELYAFTDTTFETRADLIDPRTGDFACEGAESNTTWGHIWTYDYSYIFSDDGSSNLPTQLSGSNIYRLQFDYDGSLAANLDPIPAAANGQLVIPEGWYPIGIDRVSTTLDNNYHPLMDQDAIIPITDRYTIYADAAYELTDSVEFYTELLYNKRKTFFNSSRQVWQFGVGEDDLGLTDLLFGFGGALGPIGDPLSGGFSGPALFSPTAFIDHGNSSQEVDYYRGVAGFRGDLFSSWSYDIYGQYSLSDATYTNDRILQDSIDTQDFRGGFTPSPCEGVVTTPIGGKQCVDVDWYSARAMFGDFTQEEFEFLTGTEVGSTEYTQWYGEAVVTGDLFEIWGGTVGVALGGTFRRDEINDVPGEITLANNAWQSGGAGITAGKSDTIEGFGEVSIPLLADLPLIQSLDLSAAARITSVKATRASDGESSSNNGNWTYKFGADWQVTDWLRFRGTYGTSFRAPALFEQFLADQESSLPQRSLDPCIRWGTNLANGDISQLQADNCAADGVDPDHTGAGINGVVVTGGGLGVLAPETSTAWTASVILEPDFAFLPNTQISLAVDYFDIEVNGEIARFGAGNVIGNCYRSEFFPDEPLCDLFRRIDQLDLSDPAEEQYFNAGNSSNIAVVFDSFININSQKNTGVDVTGRIVHDFAGDTTLTIQAQMTWQTSDEIAVFDGLPTDLNGRVGEPEWVGDFNVILETGPWAFFYNLDVVGAASNFEDYIEDNAGVNPFDPNLTPAQQALVDNAQCPTFLTYGFQTCLTLDVPATFYHAFSVTRSVNENFEITVGVSNLFDTKPPRTSNVGGDLINQLGDGVLYSQYDFLGRRGFVNLNFRY